LLSPSPALRPPVPPWASGTVPVLAALPPEVREAVAAADEGVGADGAGPQGRPVQAAA
jgi:hypothetical protein